MWKISFIQDEHLDEVVMETEYDMEEFVAYLVGLGDHITDVEVAELVQQEEDDWVQGKWSDKDAAS